MVLNWSTNWSQNTTCTAGSGQIDQISTLTHELGHWYGSSHSTDQPISTRTATNTMLATSITGCDKRTVEQDDMNIVLHGERANSQIASNFGFEDGHPGASPYNGGLHWRFLASTAGNGGATRYWDPGNAYQGALFIQMNSGSGVAASIYQDMFPRGNGVTAVTPNVRVRNDSSGTGTAQLVLWEMDAAGGPFAHVRNCSITAGAGYSYCGATYNVNSDHLRLQVYNYTNGNMSIDNFRMWAND